jgi:hypothetical protein
VHKHNKKITRSKSKRDDGAKQKARCKYSYSTLDGTGEESDLQAVTHHTRNRSYTLTEAKHKLIQIKPMYPEKTVVIQFLVH